MTTAEPSKLLRHVFSEHTEYYGDPDMHYPLDAAIVHGEPIIDRLDIFVWHPNDENPMTTFSTVGMSDKSMHGCDHRSEIHLSVRGNLSEKAESAVSAYLANLAVFPFLNHTFFDYWHVVPHLRLPHFSRCSWGLFHPALTKNGWDTIGFGDLKIKLLNLIPITTEENEMAKSSGVNKLLDHLYDNHKDIFSDRTPHAED
jgi:hypothetical protein